MPPLPPTFSLILTMGSTTLMHTIANSLLAIYVISSTLLILPTCVTTRSEAPYIIWSISSKFYFKARHHQFGQCSTIFTPCSKCKSKECSINVLMHMTIHERAHSDRLTIPQGTPSFGKLRDHGKKNLVGVHLVTNYA